ncbi:MAG TPA: serine hydrolase domain-containing protein [Chloroflexota bacterium]|nr:serine hydrolase domain-containing protein [Chloroflexota bacterium]
MVLSATPRDAPSRRGDGRSVSLGNAQRFGLADAILGRDVAGAQTPGAVLAVARRSGPVRTRAFGLARWEPDEAPVRDDTIFALASVTKSLVAVAVLQQVERGTLLLDDPAVVHVPEFHAGEPRKASVTVRHLLAHTSGLDEEWVNARYRDDPERTRTWDAQVAVLCAAPLVFAPGERFAYANANTSVLAEIVRRCSGLMIDTYLERHVFAPLGMADTSFFPQDASPERVADVAPRGWPAQRRPRATINSVFPADLRVPRPSGGLYSTAADLVTLGRAFLHCLRGELYPAESGTVLLTRPGMRLMLEDQAARGLPGPPRGLWVELAASGHLPFFSPAAFALGGSTGVSLRVDPEQDLVVAFLANCLGWDKRARECAINAAVAAMAAPAASDHPDGPAA